VLSPVDLQRQEHGTWIGISKTGRLCVLLNCHEDTNTPNGKVSRGLFARDFLLSDLAPDAWIESVRQRVGSKHLDEAGGFWMMCGQLQEYRDHHNGLRVFTNRPQAFLHESPDSETICISNGFDESWAKLQLGRELLDSVVDESVGTSEAELIDRLFGVLSKDTYPDQAAPNIYDLRKSVFIPPLRFSSGGVYGTRTQTVLLVDESGRVRYIERNLDTTERSEYSFMLKDWDAVDGSSTTTNVNGTSTSSSLDRTTPSTSSGAETTAIYS
jgi:uncharacterized protein with NRDE domain